jgi:GNAT superfamily N-acetyltransferase
MRNPLIETSTEEAIGLLQTALHLDQTLTYQGIGTALTHKIEEAARARGDNPLEARRQAHEKWRNHLWTTLDEIAACADWIKQQTAIRSWNMRHTSYGYKHYVESWFRVRGHHIYVSNGSFIAAATGLGWEGKKELPLNAFYKFSERTMKPLLGNDYG